MTTEALEHRPSKGSIMAASISRPIMLLHAAMQAVEAGFKDLETGVTARQWTVLEMVGLMPGASQTQLCEAAYMDASTMTPLLDRLVQKKLLVKERIKGNRRTMAVKLTPAGKQLLDDRQRDVSGFCSQVWKRAGGPNAPLREGLMRLSSQE